MNKLVAVIIAFLSVASVAAATDANKPFVPISAPSSRTVVRLTVLPQKNMPFVSATLNGKKCNLLFDTGATHTTFDIGFLQRELPGIKLGEVMLAGKSNVRKAPKIFHADSLKLGNAEFAEFKAMALDISHLMSGIGVRVDGIVGMNVIGCVPTLVSLGSKKAVFNPNQSERSAFGKGIARMKERPFSVALSPSFNGKQFPLIVDSAASLTFLSKAIGWPTAKKTVELSAVAVNGGEALSTEAGASGKLMLGENVEITPMLTDALVSRIGADTLLKYDMLIKSSEVCFLRFFK